ESVPPTAVASANAPSSFTPDSPISRTELYPTVVARFGVGRAAEGSGAAWFPVIALNVGGARGKYVARKEIGRRGLRVVMGAGRDPIKAPKVLPAYLVWDKCLVWNPGAIRLTTQVLVFGSVAGSDVPFLSDLLQPGVGQFEHLAHLA